MPYLTTTERCTLRAYKYRGQDHSLLFKYVLSPWAEFCVRTFVPLWVA